MHGLKSTLNSEKLLTTLERRSFYYRHFQLYVKLGMEVEVVAIHSALAFCQAPFIKSYVELNSVKRAKTTNKF